MHISGSGPRRATTVAFAFAFAFSVSTVLAAVVQNGGAGASAFLSVAAQPPNSTSMASAADSARTEVRTASAIGRIDTLGAPSGAITFSELAVGTTVTDQYRDRGVIFGGSSTFIVADGSNPTSPVLSGFPRFTGPIRLSVVEPATGQPGTADGIAFDVGYIDNPNSVQIDYLDSNGAPLGSARANALGINRIVIPIRGVASAQC